MAGRKSDFTLPTNTLDELFSSQEERESCLKSGIFRLRKSTISPTTRFRCGKMRICFSSWKV